MDGADAVRDPARAPHVLALHARRGGARAVEVERLVSRGGLVSLGPRRLLAAEILAGQLVGIHIDPATRVLLRTRPNPLSPDETARLRGARPAGQTVTVLASDITLSIEFPDGETRAVPPHHHPAGAQHQRPAAADH